MVEIHGYQLECTGNCGNIDQIRQRECQTDGPGTGSELPVDNHCMIEEP
jgi:hypothetical protein